MGGVPAPPPADGPVLMWRHTAGPVVFMLFAGLAFLAVAVWFGATS
ncbi:hypothetical protein [Streptomyces sp. NPDC058476]